LPFLYKAVLAADLPWLDDVVRGNREQATISQLHCIFCQPISRKTRRFCAGPEAPLPLN